AVAEDHRELLPGGLLDQLLGHGAERRELVLLAAGGRRALGEPRCPLPHIFWALLAEVVERSRLLAEQRGAHRLSKHRGRHGEILEDEPPAEPRDHDPVTAP